MKDNERDNISLCNSIELTFIGSVESPYKEKFAIPRQPNLVSAAKGKIRLLGETNNYDLVRDIEQFSHLWVLFIFNATQEQGWKPLVRPPRLGGNKKTGVLATRSTFRPNPIGMSVVKLERVEKTLTKGKQQTILHISGLDLLHNTPIVDIKPYVPYSDAISNANGGFAHQEPKTELAIRFTNQGQNDLAHHQKNYDELALFIEQVLRQDPRPAYKKNNEDDKVYGMRLYDLNIKWRMVGYNRIEVIKIDKYRE